VKVAAPGRVDAAKTDRVAEKAQERYERALGEDDDDAADINQPRRGPPEAEHAEGLRAAPGGLRLAVRDRLRRGPRRSADLT
jgi:hypothetical protein